MNGCCDYCEAIDGREVVLHANGVEECEACAEARDKREAAAEEQSMTRSERIGWMRARDEGVD